jgi:hypothetical protein
MMSWGGNRAEGRSNTCWQNREGKGTRRPTTTNLSDRRLQSVHISRPPWRSILGQRTAFLAARRHRRTCARTGPTLALRNDPDVPHDMPRAPPRVVIRRLARAPSAPPTSIIRRAERVHPAPHAARPCAILFRREPQAIRPAPLVEQARGGGGLV